MGKGPSKARRPPSADDDPEVEVWAAGGVIVDDDDRVLVAHRPRYDDWTFPKGKLDDGETLAECALREVLEETGLTCKLGEPVAAVRYLDNKGRTKEVRYWAMTVIDGSFVENDEVDAVEWLSVDDTGERLSYDHDRDVLDAFVDS